MAAAFVTPSDLAVAGFARGLVQRYDRLLAAKFNRSSIGKAAVLFDALGDLAPGKEMVLKIKARAEAEGNHMFRAEVYCKALGTKLVSEETTRFYRGDVGLTEVLVHLIPAAAQPPLCLPCDATPAVAGSLAQATAAR